MKKITEIVPLDANFTWSINLFEVTENIPAHYHKLQTQLVMILQGALMVQVNNKKIMLTAGDYIAIPPYVVHSFYPQEKTCFLTIDFPGFHFPDDVYSDEPNTKGGECFIFQGKKENMMDTQTALSAELVEALACPKPLSAELYLEKFSQAGYDVYALAQDPDKNKWSLAILDVHEAPEHYHKIETEHFIVLNGKLEIILDGVAHHFLPGQSVHILPGVHHFIKSALPTPVRLLCVNLPCFDPSDFYPTAEF